MGDCENHDPSRIENVVIEQVWEAPGPHPAEGSLENRTMLRSGRDSLHDLIDCLSESISEPRSPTSIPPQGPAILVRREAVKLDDERAERTAHRSSRSADQGIELPGSCASARLRFSSASSSLSMG